MHERRLVLHHSIRHHGTARTSSQVCTADTQTQSWCSFHRDSNFRCCYSIRSNNITTTCHAWICGDILDLKMITYIVHSRSDKQGLRVVNDSQGPRILDLVMSMLIPTVASEHPGSLTTSVVQNGQSTLSIRTMYLPTSLSSKTISS